MTVKISFILCALCLFLHADAWANSEQAKQTLSQSTTNSFCTAGYNGPNPYEKSAYDQSEAAKSICEGKDVIDCYRSLWKKSGNTSNSNP